MILLLSEHQLVSRVHVKDPARLSSLPWLFMYVRLGAARSCDCSRWWHGWLHQDGGGLVEVLVGFW